MRVKVLLCVVLVVGPGALAASPPKGETVPRSLREEKPLEKLETALQRADLVVVGKLGKLTPLKGGTVLVSGDIAVAEVLKGPADAKSVTLRSLNPEQVKEKGPGAFQGIFWPEGKDGIWILRKHWEGQHYVADNLAHFQPKANEQEVKRILRAWANAKSATTERVVRDGIALSVSVKPLVLASGDMLFYTVTLQNVSDKDIRMYRTNRDDLRFVALATGKVWVTQASRFPPPVAPPALSTFKPKEVWVWTTEIAINSKFVEAGGKPEDAREGLPAGRYRLEYSTTFMDHYPGGKAVYTGTIQAKPVELKIAEKSAGAK